MQQQLNQLSLVSAIFQEVNRQGVQMLCPRHQNAVIAAADAVIAALAVAPTMAEHNMGLEAWLASDDVGASSCFMASVLGQFSTNANYAHPYDLDDFGRCSRLLDAVPELRSRLDLLAEQSPEWSRLVDCWDRIEAIADNAEAEYTVRRAVATDVRDQALTFVQHFERQPGILQSRTNDGLINALYESWRSRDPRYPKVTVHECKRGSGVTRTLREWVQWIDQPVLVVTSQPQVWRDFGIDATSWQFTLGVGQKPKFVLLDAPLPPSSLQSAYVTGRFDAWLRKLRFPTFFADQRADAKKATS